MAPSRAVSRLRKTNNPKVRVLKDRVQVGTEFTLVLHRTLRVPDEPDTDKGFLLPPNLGPMPLHRTLSVDRLVPPEWRREDAVFAPLRTREAMWLDFVVSAPHAVLVAAGSVNVVTGNVSSGKLERVQNYLVCPPQEWLDGIHVGQASVRQFVGMPLGEGYTAEAQVIGNERGSIEIKVCPLKPGIRPKTFMGGGGSESVMPQQQGLAVGGKISQRIHPDPYGLEAWDTSRTAAITIYLVTADQYTEWTGLEAPGRSPTAEDYTAAGLPWFEHADEAWGDVQRSPPKTRLRSVAELDRLRGEPSESANRKFEVPSGNIIRTRATRKEEQKERNMNESSDLKARKRQVMRFIPDVGELQQIVEENADSFSAPIETEAPLRRGDVAVPLEGPRRRAIIARPERERAVEDGKRAIQKLKRDKDAGLTHEELNGLEAIVLLEKRPALLVQNGTFSNPPDSWSILNRPNVRPGIEKNIASVGRIEVTNHPEGLDWIGTGFLVADDVLITNRHVAVEFAQTLNGKTWQFLPGMKANIDYVEEFNSTQTAPFKITEVIGIHNTFDIALLRVAAGRSAKRPKPLSITANPKLTKKQKVYIVGYPASDSRRNDPVHMRRIFEDIFDVKRLQPGEVMKPPVASLVQHDCSTLGGNSGSCLVDLDTQQVIGLHFSGRYLEANLAIVLGELTKDPLIKKAKLNFV